MSLLYSQLLPGTLECTVFDLNGSTYLRCKWQHGENTIVFDTPVVESVAVTEALAMAKLELMLYHRAHENSPHVRTAVISATLRKVGLQNYNQDQVEKMFRKLVGKSLSEASAHDHDIDYFCAQLLLRYQAKRTGESQEEKVK